MTGLLSREQYLVIKRSPIPQVRNSISSFDCTHGRCRQAHLGYAIVSSNDERPHQIVPAIASRFETGNLKKWQIKNLFFKLESRRWFFKRSKFVPESKLQFIGIQMKKTERTH